MNIWRSLRGLPRDIWVLAGATLVNRAGTMVLPFLVLYLTRELGFTPAHAGLALAVYGAGAIIVAPIAGRLSDRIGPLPIMQASLVGNGLLLLIFPFVETFAGVIGLTLAWALVSESFRPANLAIVADLVPPEQRKPAFALSRLAINLGMSVGPAVAGFLAAQSFRWIFVVDAITTIAAGLVLIAIPLSAAGRRYGGSERPDAAPRAPSGLPAALEDKRLLLFLMALFLTGIVFFQHEGALPLFLVEDLRLSPAFYGMLFTINTLMIVFMEVPLNAATSHWPHRWGLSLGAMLFAAGSGIFVFASGPGLIVAGIVIWTFGEMMLFPQAAAYVADIAPAHRRGEYMGAYSLAFSLAFAVAPWAGTAAFAEFGSTWLWAGVFIVGSASAAMMLYVSSDEVKPAAALG
ncbi:MAG: MFS transporter [Gemmatimonadaceae bacterium]|nr:MFS transporter [Gemmatimonadaceae bacterium]